MSRFLVFLRPLGLDLHIEVHHKALVAWWKRLEDSVNDKSDRSHVVLCAKELSRFLVFLRPLGLRLFQELKLIFQANARIERYEVSNKFYSCKMEENSSVSEHILQNVWV